MVNKLKMALRVSHNELDVELLSFIEIAKMDLKLSGVKKIDANDPLIIQAIITYVKAQYETNVDKAIRLDEAYIRLKKHLSLAGEYCEK